MRPHPLVRTSLAFLACCLLVAGCASGPVMDPQKELEMRKELALRYYDMDDLQRAEEQARRGLEIDPDDMQLQLLIGWVRERRGRAEDVFYAETIFRGLEGRGDFRAWLGLAQALERKGVFYSDTARDIRSGELVTDALDPQKRADEYDVKAKESWTEAVTWYQKVLTKRDGEPQSLNGLMRTEALLGNYEDSLRWARLLIDQCDQEIAIWTKQLGRADLRADEEEALRGLRKATQKLVVECRMQAATLLLSTNRPTEALVQIDQALAVEPDKADIHGRRAQVLMELGRYAEALASLDAFLKHSDQPFESPDIQKAYDLIAQCKSHLAQAPTGGG